MAYKKGWNNFRSRAGGYARKAGGYARTAGGYARRGAYRAGGYARRAGGYAYSYQKKANQGIGPDGFKVYPDIPLGAGVVVGLSDVDRMIPGEAILLGAALPIGGKYGRSVRNFFGGVILGELISKLTKFKIPLGTAKTDSVTGFYA